MVQAGVEEAVLKKEGGRKLEFDQNLYVIDYFSSISLFSQVTIESV